MVPKTLPPLKYRQLPLKSGSDSIRLLKLRASKDNLNDPIKCELSEAPISSNPTYFALSYCWGSELDKIPIVILDQGTEYTISVARSLHSAFFEPRRLESEDSNGVPIWADAVCINQDDLDERARKSSSWVPSIVRPKPP